jgi:predicted Zn-dependent protease
MTPPEDEKPATSAEIERYQAELKADPRSRSFVPLAAALAAAGRHQEVVDACRRGLAAHPDLPEGRLLLARACLSLKKPSEAIIECTKLLKQDPNGRETLLLLGAALLDKGDANRAQQALQRAAAIYPGDPEITAKLAEATSRLRPGAPLAVAAAAPGPKPAAAPGPKPAAAPVPKPAAAPAKPAAPVSPKPTAAAAEEIAQEPEAEPAAPSGAASGKLPLPKLPPKPVAAPVPWKAPAAAVPPPDQDLDEAERELAEESLTPPARPVPREVLATAAPAPTPSPEPAAPPAASPQPPNVYEGALPETFEDDETRRVEPGRAPPRMDGTLATTVLRPDAPLQAARKAEDTGEEAWHRARRVSMLLVWGTALGVVLLVTGITLTMAMMRRAEVERRFSSGAASMALASPQSYRAAAADYREILRREPDNTKAAAHLGLAVAALATTYGEGADSATQAQVQRAWIGEQMRLRRKPGSHSAEALSSRILAALLQGERTDAERLSQQAASLHPRAPSVLYAAGLTRWAVGDIEGASSALKAVLTEAPDQAAPRLALAAIDLDRGALTDASAAYAAILGKHPDHGGALLGRALFAIDEGRGAEVLEEVKGKLAQAALPPDGTPTTSPTGEKLAPVGLEAWRQLALGQCLQQRGATAEAQAAIEAATVGAPPDPRFQLRLVRARLAQGRITEARVAFQQLAKQLNVSHPAVLLVSAELGLAQGFDAEAEKFLEAAPRSPTRDFALGRARLALGKAGPALEAFKAVQPLRPKDPQLKVYVLLAEQLAAGPQPGSPAVAELKQLATGAGAGLAHWALGRIFLAAGDSSQARAWLAAAQGDHYESHRAAVTLANLLRDKREPGAAQEVLEKSLERGGEFVPARAALGRLYELLFRNLEARAALSRALGLEGTARGPRGYAADPDDYVALALADARLGFLGDAETALQRGIEAKAAGPRLVRAQSLLQALRGEAAAAEKALAKVKDADVPLRVDLGAVARAAGDAKGAETAYNAALRDDPDHVEGLLGLGQLYLLMPDRSTQAIATFTRALAAYEKRPYLGKSKRGAIQVGLGRAFLLAGPQRNPERARAALEGAVADAPNDSDAHLHLGAYRLGEGDLQKAAASAVRALALDPGSAEAQWVLAEAVVKNDPRRAKAAYTEYLRLAKDGPHASGARQALERLK